MSMLAEPRRKQRIGPNPRGKFFTEDEDNRGRNMLQKMGWSNGDGLGVERQGIREPIRPKIQTDSKGLGFDVKSDPWVSHNDDFNEVLKNLQAANGVTNDQEEESQGNSRGFGFKTEDASHEEKHVNLENNSKSSRSRIHYHKFVKNKDLSKIKSEDWNCIFGKPVSDLGYPNKKIQEQADDADNEKGDDYSSELFINRGSLRDYFKCKRAQKFVKPEYHKDDSTDTVFKREDEETEDSPHTIKNSKKSKATNVENIYDPKQLAWEEWKASMNEETEPPAKKKKKEKLEIEDIDNSVVDEEITETEKPKKKKKRTKHREEYVPTDSVEPHSINEYGAESMEVDANQSSLIMSESNPEVEHSEIATLNEGCEKSKKKKNKKSKKNKDADVYEECEAVNETTSIGYEESNFVTESVESESRQGEEQKHRKDFNGHVSGEKTKKKKIKPTVEAIHEPVPEETEKFVNRGSMEDYFKSKMANRMGLKSSESPQHNEEVCSENVSENNLVKTKKKKEKKVIEIVQNDDDLNNVEDSETTEKFVNRGSMEDYFKSKMASKISKSACDSQDQEMVLENGVNEHEVAKPKKKKDKKVKEAKTDEIIEASEESEVSKNIVEDDHENIKIKKKKDKKTKLSSEIQEDQGQGFPDPPMQDTQENSVESTTEMTQAIENKVESNTEPSRTEGAKDSFKKQNLSAKEYHEAAKEFSGSNLLKIPGYRNQSNKFL